MADNTNVTPIAEAQRASGIRAMASALLARAGLGRRLGITFQGKRDHYTSFGWPDTIGAQELFGQFNRGGIAKRIAEAHPASTWGRPPVLYIPGNDTWTEEFGRLAWNLDLWSALYNADVLARIGGYAVILVGTNRGALDQPIPKGGAGGLKITFMQPYTSLQATVAEWENDPTSERFGLPKFYQINPNIDFVGMSQQNPASGQTVPFRGMPFKVHYSRIIHVTASSLQSKVEGPSVYVPVWNYLLDLEKVIGSSSESYWRNAYQGLHADVDKEMDLDPADEAALSEEMDEYEHNLRRIVRTRGVKVKAIGSTVADPRGAFDVILTLISGTTGIPKRILLGSEAGQLASSQDKANWAERVEEYREMHAEPNVLWPFVMWCLQNKLLPTVDDITSIKALWPDAYRMSPLERGQTAAQTARSLANIAKGMAPIVLKPGKPATPDSVGPDGTTIPGDPGTEDELGEALITRDEGRRIIGLSTDQNILIQRPEES